MSSVMYKAFMLAMYNEFAGSPDFMLEELEMMKKRHRWMMYGMFTTDTSKGKNYVATSFVPKGQADLVAEGSVNAGIVEEDITKATQMEVVAGG